MAAVLAQTSTLSEQVWAGEDFPPQKNRYFIYIKYVMYVLVKQLKKKKHDPSLDFILQLLTKL